MNGGDVRLPQEMYVRRVILVNRNIDNFVFMLSFDDECVRVESIARDDLSDERRYLSSGERFVCVEQLNCISQLCTTNST